MRETYDLIIQDEQDKILKMLNQNKRLGKWHLDRLEGYYLNIQHLESLKELL